MGEAGTEVGNGEGEDSSVGRYGSSVVVPELDLDHEKEGFAGRLGVRAQGPSSLSFDAEPRHWNQRW